MSANRAGMNPLDRLLTVLSPNLDKIVTQNDIEEILLGITKLLESYKQKTNDLNDSTLKIISSAVSTIKKETGLNLEHIQEVSDLSQIRIENLKSSAESAQTELQLAIKKSETKAEKLKEQIAKIEVLLGEYKSIEVKDGYTPVKGVDYFTEDEKREVIDIVKKESKLSAEELRDLLETLEGEDRLDAESIKNLPQVQKIIQGGGATKLLRILDIAGLKNEDADEIIFGNNLTVTTTPNGVRVDATGGGAGVSEHGALTGLSDDDHPQYLNETRGDTRYYQKSEVFTKTETQAEISALVDTAPTTLNTLNELAAALGDDPNFATTITAQLGNKANLTHTHTITDTTGLQTALDSKAATSHTHTASQVSDFNTAVSVNADVSANTSSRHTHTNKTILDTTTASFTTAQESKLSGIQAGAEVNVNADWNAVSGDAQILNKPATMPPSAHTHVVSEVTGLQTALDSKAATSHSHALDNLSNVTITSPTSGQVLKFNGSEWINDVDSTASGEGGVTDHGALTGLGDDDHTQYHTDARGDARYYTKSEVDASLSVKANSTHTHLIGDVTGLQTGLDAKVPYTGATSNVDLGAYKLGFDVASPAARVDLNGSDFATSSYHSTRYSDNNFGSTLRQRKARGTSTTPTATISGDVSGRMEGQAYNGTTFATVGTIDIRTKTAGATPSGDIVLAAANTSGTLTTLLTVSNEAGVVSNVPVSSTKGFVKRSQTLTSTATLTPSWDTDDNIFVTAQAANITIANPTGTPTQGQTIMIRLKDNGTARTITFGANYRAFVAALPTTTTISKTMYIGLVANTTDTKVDTTAMSEV